MFTAILLEGITGAGKSTIFQALRTGPWTARYESCIVLSQAVTLRVAPPERITAHLCRLSEQIRTHAEDHNASEFAGRADMRGSMLVLAEGFHCYGLLEHVPAEQRHDALRRVESCLNGAAVLLVSLELDEDVISERSVLSPLRHRGPGWRTFVARYGSTTAQIAEHYVARQRAHRDLVAASSLRVLRINTSVADWPEYADRIRAHLPITNGVA
jgi:chloramphenicol 3-O-phosphotransferase